MTTPLTVLSLFSGIGGIDLGLERLGCETHWYSDVDPYANQVMNLRFPNAEPLGDITTIDWSTLNAQPDIICGGFPCQDISLAGQGGGIAEGTRSGLWSYYADSIRILRPRLVIVENVAALLARGLDRVLGDLAACGYDAEWDCIPAASVGAPHRRDRLFIIGYRANAESNSVHANSERRETRRELCERSGQIEPNRDVDGRQPTSDTANQRRTHGVNGTLRHGPWPAPRSVIASNATGERQSRQRQHGEPIGTTQSGIGQADHVVSNGGINRGESGEFWSVEPGMGGLVDGLSARLDASPLDVSVAMSRIMEHANATETRPREVLHSVRREIDTQDICEWAPGGSGVVPTSEVLLAFMCQLEATIREGEASMAVEVAKTQGAKVRGVWADGSQARPSHRRRHNKRPTLKHSDIVHALSQLLARDAGEAWIAHCGKDAATAWQGLIAPRVANGIPKRVDRLRCLGNAVVPQVAEHVGRIALSRLAGG